MAARARTRVGLVVELPGMHVQAFEHDLGVADRAELARDPLQLLAQRAGGLLLHQRREGGQGAAQPAGGHPHLVDRVGQVAADRDVGQQQVAHVQGEDRADGVDRQARRSGDRQLGHVRRLCGARPERARCLADRARLGAHAHEEVDDGIHRRERSRVGGIDGLDLDLAEDTDHPSVAQDGHHVVDDLDEGPALGIVQELGRALGRDGHHGPQRPLAQEGCDHLDEAAGHRADLAVVQRQAELVARGAVGARDRELHVPARVVTALAASQGDAPAEQRQVGGVVVDGPHREGLDDLDGMSNAGLGEVGQVEHPVHAELALHLAVGGRSAHVIPRIVRLGLTGRSRACA